MCIKADLFALNRDMDFQDCAAVLVTPPGNDNMLRRMHPLRTERLGTGRRYYVCEGTEDEPVETMTLLGYIEEDPRKRTVRRIELVVGIPAAESESSEVVKTAEEQPDRKRRIADEVAESCKRWKATVHELSDDDVESVEKQLNEVWRILHRELMVRHARF